MPRGVKALTPEDITAVIARANPSWGTHGRGRCYEASVRLFMAMKERGHEDVKIIQADFSGGNHFAVFLNETVYDLTARQFQDCTLEQIPFPYITDFGSYINWLEGFAPGELIVNVE